MTIRNRKAFMEALWDWGILDGCFGASKIRPTDIDGLVERNGRFLMLEAKGRGKNLSFGQYKTFKQLQRTGRFTIIVIWGDANQPEKLKVMTRTTDRMLNDANLETFRSVVMQWYTWANTPGNEA